MMITKDRIWAQIQEDSAEYDAFSDALKEVLLKEVELARSSHRENDRSSTVQYMSASAGAA